MSWKKALFLKKERLPSTRRYMKDFKVDKMSNTITDYANALKNTKMTIERGGEIANITLRQLDLVVPQGLKGVVENVVNNLPSNTKSGIVWNIIEY